MIDLYDKSHRGPLELSATSTTLLRGLREDEAAAWERLTAKYAYAVYRWTRRAGLSPQDAQDVTQEVFQSALLSLPNFRCDKPTDTFRGWLRRITQRRISDHYRENRPRPDQATGGVDHVRELHEVVKPPERDGSQQSGPKELVREVVEAFRKRCSDQNWEMFSQMIFHERSPEEVAEAFGVPLSRVYNIKCHYLRRLREKLLRAGFSGRQPE